ncbi:MAG: hypothetical protein ACRDVL_12330 [Acidimicrobiia bacterium]
MGLIEVRDYHYDESRLDAYRIWATEAGEFLRNRWDMSGFWIDSGEPARISGSDPMDPEHGSANVTWVLRWQNLEEREAAWDDLWKDQAWERIWSRHPGYDGYLQLSVRFLDEV